MSELDPLPPEIRALLDAERRAPEDSEPPFKREVLSRIELVAGVSPSTRFAPSWKARLPLLKVAAPAFVAGLVSGGVALDSWRSREQPATSVLESPDAGVVERLLVSAPPDAGVPQAVEATDASVISMEPRRPAPIERASDLEKERQVLDAARAGIARNELIVALAAIERHARQWPDGAMREERELLWVQALMLRGQREQAVRRAEAFRRRFPRSILGPAMEATLETDTATDREPETDSGVR